MANAPFERVRVGSDVTSMLLSGLVAFVNYEVRVRGENAVGLGDPSNTIFGRTHPSGKKISSYQALLREKIRVFFLQGYR